MILHLIQEKAIGDVQQDFSQAYPFLKIEFYKLTVGRLGSTVKQKLNRAALMNAACLLRQGEIELSDTMTIGQLVKIFLVRYGISVQISRKSGILWLETTMTDSWTLKQQNDHGRELS